MVIASGPCLPPKLDRLALLRRYRRPPSPSLKSEAGSLVNPHLALPTEQRRSFVYSVFWKVAQEVLMRPDRIGTVVVRSKKVAPVGRPSRQPLGGSAPKPLRVFRLMGMEQDARKLEGRPQDLVFLGLLARVSRRYGHHPVSPDFPSAYRIRRPFSAFPPRHPLMYLFRSCWPVGCLHGNAEIVGCQSNLGG